MQRIIEALETRIAPAAVFTYTEADGDIITIATSAKIGNADFAAYINANANFSDDIGGDLLSLNLDDAVFRNSNLTITVQPAGGNGLASIGHIYASVDLKNVVINGDLGSIEVGDYNLGTPALNKLQVVNLGGEGSSSYINGDATSIKISNDLTGSLYVGSYNNEDYGDANIKTLNVGGSIRANGYYSPEIEAERINSLIVGGDVEARIDAFSYRTIRIGGDLRGGEDWGSGSIDGETAKSIRIGGSIIGGNGEESGSIDIDNVGSIFVGGSIQGGSGWGSGRIEVDDEVSRVTIIGSVIGGAGELSGTVLGEDQIGTIRIDGDVIAGSGFVSGVVGGVYAYTYYQGYYDFYFEGNVEKIVIRGSVIGTDGGEFAGSIIASRVESLRIEGSLVGGGQYLSGSVYAVGVTKAFIGESLVGGTGEYSGSFSAGGIGSLRVVGSVLGGEGLGSASIYGDYGIATVKIGGDVVSVGPYSAEIGAYAGAIGSITIGGSLSSTVASQGDYTGIYAYESIDRITIGGSVTGASYGELVIRAGYNHSPYSYVPAIGSIGIKGDVTNLAIEAGVDQWGYVNPTARIGTVSISGDFKSSSISAGVGAGVDGYYGTADDCVPGGNPDLVSRIANVVIGGVATGTTDELENYGVFAQHIVALKVNGAKLSLNTGAGNDLVGALLSGSSNVRYKEIPLALPG